MRRVLSIITVLWLLTLGVPKAMAQLCTASNTRAVDLVAQSQYSLPLNVLSTTLCFRVTAPSPQFLMHIDSDANLEIGWRKALDQPVVSFGDVKEMLWSIESPSDGPHIGELSVGNSGVAQILGTITLAALVRVPVDSYVDDFEGEDGWIPNIVHPYSVTIPAFGGSVGIPVAFDCYGEVTVNVVVEGILEDGDVGFLNDAPRPREESTQWNAPSNRKTFTVTYSTTEDERFHSWVAYAINTTNQDIHALIEVPDPECRPNTTVVVSPARQPSATPVVSTSSLSGVVTGGEVNIRPGPGVQFEPVITRLANGTSVIVIGRAQLGDPACGLWVQLSEPVAGWIYADLLSISGDMLSLPVTQTLPGRWWEARSLIGVKGETTLEIRLRGGPGTDYIQLCDPWTVENNAVVDVVGRANGFLLINIGRGAAWIYADYVQITEGSLNQIPVIDVQD